jgi:hypothetical protein
VFDGELGDGVTFSRVLVQPQAEGVLRDAGNEGGAFTRGQALLGLAAELRFDDLCRQHEGLAVP